MSLKLWCVLSKDNTLTPIEVAIDPTASVSSLKDAIRAKMTPDLDYLPASRLTLVRVCNDVLGGMTKKELKQSNEALSLTSYGDDPEDPDVDDDVSVFHDAPGVCLVKDKFLFKVMSTIETVSFFTDSLPARLCHVLVLVPKQSSPTNSLQSLTMELNSIVWKNSSVMQHKHSADMHLFHLDSDYLNDSGLPATKLVLYCRSRFHDQFNFLKEQVMRNAHLGWILGPPGTGKSTTSLAFISVIPALFPGWKVTWIHLSRPNYPVCVRFDSVSKASCIIPGTSIRLVQSILNEITGNHVVFVDGFALNGLKHVEVQQCCYAWRKENPTTRRLVVVCSMSSRGKTSLDDDSIDRVKEFFVYSWKLEEYLLAAQYGDFIDGVKQNLDSSVLTEVPPSNVSEMPILPISSQDLVISKFHFAGGSSRFMFHYPTTVVISYLEESVDGVGDILPYLQGTVGDRSKNVVNRLFGCYSNNGIKKSFIVSKYAATLLAIRRGPDLISNMAQATSQDRNPSMDGWFLEMWFFASLRKGGLQVYPKEIDGVAVKPEFWEETQDVKTLDPTKISSIPNGGTWWKPVKWNQGGYDAVRTIINGYDEEQKKRRGSITFIQVTSGDTHSFKIEFFYQLLLALSNSEHGYIIDDLKIIFLVERSKLQTFQISNVTGSGLLHAFKWAKYEETKLAAVYGVDGFRQ